MLEQKSYTLAELAVLLDAQVQGDANCRVTGVATLHGATDSQLSFLANPAYEKHLASTSAAVVIVSPKSAALCPVNALIHTNPYLAYAKVTRLFDTQPSPTRCVHPSAVVAEDAEIGNDVSIGANAVIESGASLADGVIIGAGSIVGEGVIIGKGSRLYTNVSVYYGVSIGSDCIIHSGAVIGSDGFGFAPTGQGWEKIAQLGGVIIGNNVEIGANTTIDRGALDDTVIGTGVILDNQIQIAHNVTIGENTAIAGCTVIAGSTRVGANCIFGGACAISGHLEIADNVHLTGMAMITKSISSAGVYSSGTSFETNGQWRKNVARFRQLDDMARRLRKVEKSVLPKN